MLRQFMATALVLAGLFVSIGQAQDVPAGKAAFDKLKKEFAGAAEVQDRDREAIH